MPDAAIMGRPKALNKAKGPGIIPIPYMGGSWGMSTKPPMTIARYKVNAINWSLHSIRINTFIRITVERTYRRWIFEPAQEFTQIAINRPFRLSDWLGALTDVEEY